ncbi:MAG: TIGR02757 family protein [Candidatus Glassbacteria bacterium]
MDFESVSLTESELRLKRSLDALTEAYGPAFIDSDPVSYLHRYEDPADIEIAGFIAASLAYGRVAIIKRSLEFVFDVMGETPKRFIEHFDPHLHGKPFDGFVHRFTRGKDMVSLFVLLGQMVRGWGSIEGFMCNGKNPTRDVGRLLSSFSSRALSMNVAGLYPGGVIPDDAGVRFFFPSPSNGSACKRLNLFLRWMVRGPDGVDLGIWRNLKPADLVVPMDVHIERISVFLGLVGGKGSSWRKAVEITNRLRRLDATDPTKYDYALTRLGIMGLCQGGRKKLNCIECPLSMHCIYGPDSGKEEV